MEVLKEEGLVLDKDVVGVESFQMHFLKTKYV